MPNIFLAALPGAVLIVFLMRYWFVSQLAMSGVSPWCGARPPKSSPEQAPAAPAPSPADPHSPSSPSKLPLDTGQSGGHGTRGPQGGAQGGSQGGPQGACLVASGPVTVTTIPGPGPAIETNGKSPCAAAGSSVFFLLSISTCLTFSPFRYNQVKMSSIILLLAMEALRRSRTNAVCL